MSKPEVTPITAAGGIVFKYLENTSEPQVLMIFRNGYWDLPKGKLEPGESIEMCAAREVSEEVGSAIPAIIKEVGSTYHTYPEKGKTMGKTTYWYAMIFTKAEKLIPQTEEGIEKAEWILLSEAIEKSGFENLKEILSVFAGEIKKV